MQYLLRKHSLKLLGIYTYTSLYRLKILYPMLRLMLFYQMMRSQRFLYKTKKCLLNLIYLEAYDHHRCYNLLYFSPSITTLNILLFITCAMRTSKPIKLILFLSRCLIRGTQQCSWLRHYRGLQVRFLIRSFGFSIDLILPAKLLSWVRLSLQEK